MALVCASGQGISMEIPKAYSFEDIRTTINQMGVPSQGSQINNDPFSMLPNPPSYATPNTTVKNPSMWMIERYGGTPSNDPLAQYEKDLAEYNLTKQKQQATLTDAYRTMEESRIYYGFSNPNGPIHERYEAAFNELSKMLSGEQPLDLTRAQYLVESSYDNRLTFEFLKGQVMDMAYVSQLFMKREKLPPSDNLSKIMAIFHIMADTTITKVPGYEQEFTTYPMLYDFEDPWGRNDYTKMFVTKLISTGTGNCSSLPKLFLMIAEQMGAEASLAFAPEHTYVKFQGHFGEWHNVELTNQIFTTDDHIMEWGWVKSEAVKSGIYMTPISKKELIAHSVSELAMAHQKMFGNTPFLEKCTDLTLQHYPISITALMVKANYYTALMQSITAQYQDKGLSFDQIQNDPKAMSVYQEMTSLYQAIDDLGYAEVPEELYNQWIQSMDNESNKQESRNKMREMLNSIDR